jgi:C-terminal processing protease CtpA/Prc
MEYVFSVLAPQSRLQVDLRDRSGHIRKVEVVAKIRQSKTFTDVGDETGRDTWRLRLESEDQRHRMRPQSKDMGRELMIVKLPFFAFEDIDVHDMMVKARKFSTLIMDLRGNPGGASVTLQDLLGCVFDTDVKIADRVQREATKPILAKSHHNTFNGKLIVLVDSRSASAAELFARVVQIEKRGTVLGQPSSGRVMEAKFYGHKVGSNPAYFYGTSISDADLIMTDGKSLEHAGVTPDETIIPTASDLANGLDPVMARAAELAGTSLSPKQAGELFPYEWPKN